MYAILETGGKQYRVSEGDVIYVEKLGVDAEQTVTFDKILAVGEGQELKVGAPYVEGATVSPRWRRTAAARRSRSSSTPPKRVINTRSSVQPYTKLVISAIQG